MVIVRTNIENLMFTVMKYLSQARTVEPHVLQITGICRATAEILTGGEHLWWEWVSVASPVGYRVLCRFSVPICSLWLSCSTAVLSQRLFHSESKRTATHVLSALRWGFRSISAQWQARLELDQQDVMWHMPGVTYNGTIILLAPLTLNGWITHKTQQDLDTRGVRELGTEAVIM